MTKNIIILASGGGSNAESIIQFFKEASDVTIAHIFTNKASAGVLDRSTQHHIKSSVVKHTSMAEAILDFHKKVPVTAIILAGYLRKIPPLLIQSFPDRIVNIHPALLPNYGGKGMYGIHVHRAVKNAKDSQTGMTIHIVNEEYDKGRILMQGKVDISESDSPEDIAKKVLLLEHYHYPRTIAQWLGGLNPPV